jgi:hypothetical protein
MFPVAELAVLLGALLWAVNLFRTAR